MQNFTIETRTSVNQYAKVMFTGLYRKPVFIMATVAGLYYCVTIILDHFKFISFYPEVPYFEIFSGLFLLLLPVLIILMAIIQFKSNPSFQSDIIYTFGETGVTIKGLTYSGEFSWMHIIKQKEIGNFLILYHSKRIGNFIDKRKLTPDQLQFIKTKVKHK